MDNQAYLLSFKFTTNNHNYDNMKLRLITLLLFISSVALGQENYLQTGNTLLQKDTVINGVPQKTYKTLKGSTGPEYFPTRGWVLSRDWAISRVTGLQDSLANKAVLSGGNTFTGDQTINANLYLPFNRWFAYNNTSPLAPIHVGNRNVLNSSNAQILVAGTYDDTNALSGHAFSDGTLITGITGSKAYAAYDGRVDIQGSGVGMDHYVSFQHGPKLNYIGTVTDNFGLFTTTLLEAGTITNNYGAYISNPIKTGGVIDSNYGIYIANQTSGTNNWSIYSAGGFNYFGGSMQVEGTLSLNSTGQNVRFKGGGTGTTDAGIYVNGSGDTFLADWNGTRGFVTKGSGVGYYFGGNFGIGEPSPSEALDVLGNGIFSGTVSVANPTADGHAINKGYADATYVPATDITSVVESDNFSIVRSDGVYQYTYSGSYTPTLTGVLNVSSSSPVSCRYHKIGDEVFVTGSIDVTPTASGTVAIGISLPPTLTSNFTTTTDASGPISINTNTANAFALTSDSTNDRVTIGLEATATTQIRVSFNFAYTVQ